MSIEKTVEKSLLGQLEIEFTSPLLDPLTPTDKKMITVRPCPASEDIHREVIEDTKKYPCARKLFALNDKNSGAIN